LLVPALMHELVTPLPELMPMLYQEFSS
jgi:hypothetical protein